MISFSGGRTSGYMLRRFIDANAIGLRADEPRRVAKLRADPKPSPGEEPFSPLATAGVSEGDVLAFWRAQPFDLQLQSYEGNCDLCFLKGAGSIDRLLRERPDLADWWIEQEAWAEGKTKTAMGARFRKDRASYAGMLRRTHELPLLFDDAECRTDCRCTD